MDFDFDVAIVGGGPAGSTTATYLAQAGIDCVVLERETFPRPHVGESLVPSTTRILREIGFLEQMEANGFPRKYGAAWTTPHGLRAYDHDWEGIAPSDQVDVRFDEVTQEGVGQSYTYHVDRGKFDHLLLQHAANAGAEVGEGEAVTAIEFLDEGVRVRSNTGRGPKQVTARMVVDASGRRTLLGNQLRLRVQDPVFDQYALHTWFEGYDRGGGEKADYIWIHFLPVSNSWIWQIPITDAITSFGVVTQKRNFKAAKDSLDEFFWKCVEQRPDLHEKLRASHQLRPFKPEGDYSYAMKRIAGDRFVLVGDAARFVDPIFSSGVSIALNSARMASRDIQRAFHEGNFSEGAFETFSETMRNGCKHWYEFIRLYYRLNVLFTYFVSHPTYRLDVLRLLQGDVFGREEPPVLAKMREIAAEVEQNERHVWHDLLGDLTSHAFEPQF
ncbi:MAG: NAD(P)/FAD-dependent oxidoreductase [Gemmatimonadota bacterium]